MVLQNFVTLQEGVPAVMHFTEHVLAEREITDPLTGRPKTITVLELTVDALNGAAVNATFSVTSEKLAQALQPLLAGNAYRNFNVIVLKSGKGYRTEYEVQTQVR